ncbi:hypothetical protein G6L29_27545 [Agrobacterium rhizogenes]|uniref:hypothetical protein n=1 Tax=Rhizobium rhizogenes TaxID=359 RepID=UPI0004D90863|nr:hypothetical protein [Rhizobium rhizogenes]OCJ01732.1 hypothetical protein A6U85_08705 [Agrobacterium sp. 13-626]KEA08793.1 hypothetical protein CN09_24300 [Rhizobium rhizogenes]MQB30704.1 hypothetical protein [Rhizobium rhizogenes]NTF65293.1 hypothetical protein [Rhizobium rhizogenes]NTF71994.1 hypothetical protein [Rhizobium rhizogenes]
MSMQQTKVPGAAGELARKVGVGLFVCGVTVAGLYAVARTEAEAPLMSSVDVTGRGAIEVADARNFATANDLQSAVDASPAVLPTPIFRPATANKSAGAKASTPVKRVAAHAKVTSVKTVASSDVTQFDRCMPQCDTRDPMIVGLSEADQPPQDLQEQALYVPEPPEDRSPVHGVRYILSRAAEAPAFAIRKGRDAIDGVRQLEW